MRTTATAVLLGVLLLTACSGAADPGPTPVPVPPLPTGLTAPAPGTPGTPTAGSTGTPTPAAGPTAGPRATAELRYYLHRDTGEGRPWIEPVTFTYDPDEVGLAVAREAFTRLLAAPDTDGLVNLTPEGTALLDIAVADGLLTVDLSAEVTDSFAGSPWESAFQQMLAHTGAQFPTVDRVQVRVDGEPVETLWGHVDWSQPVEPDPFAISPIVIDRAAASGDTIELAGTANVFEATFDLILADEAGAAVEETFVTADCGTGCRGAWTAAFEGLAPGTYTVTAREQDASGGEGFPPYEVSVPVTVG